MRTLRLDMDLVMYRYDRSEKSCGFFYANSEPQPNAKYSRAASVVITRENSHSVFSLVALT